MLHWSWSLEHKHCFTFTTLNSEPLALKLTLLCQSRYNCISHIKPYVVTSLMHHHAAQRSCDPCTARAIAHARALAYCTYRACMIAAGSGYVDVACLRACLLPQPLQEVPLTCNYRRLCVLRSKSWCYFYMVSRKTSIIAGTWLVYIHSEATWRR